jgi:hypothetical protein
MRPPGGVVWLVYCGAIVWSSPATADTGLALATLPLKDRCAVALLIAKEVREVVELSPQGATAPEDPRKLRILISRTADGENPISIFRNREGCGKVSLPLTWTKGAKADVEFAAGDPRKLEPVAHLVVSVRSRASPGWEFIWPVDREYFGCEKGADPGAPKICMGFEVWAAPWSHLPALRIRIKRIGSNPTARHEFFVDGAALEIAKAGSLSVMGGSERVRR